MKPAGDWVGDYVGLVRAMSSHDDTSRYVLVLPAGLAELAKRQAGRRDYRKALLYKI